MQVMWYSWHRSVAVRIWDQPIRDVATHEREVVTYPNGQGLEVIPLVWIFLISIRTRKWIRVCSPAAIFVFFNCVVSLLLVEFPITMSNTNVAVMLWKVFWLIKLCLPVCTVVIKQRRTSCLTLTMEQTNYPILVIRTISTLLTSVGFCHMPKLVIC